MDVRSVRLHTRQKNIDRYQGLLKTKLSEAEKQYLEERLSEERVAIAMLDVLNPSTAPKGVWFCRSAAIEQAKFRRPCSDWRWAVDSDIATRRPVFKRIGFAAER
jgi:hypothetical protein